MPDESLILEQIIELTSDDLKDSLLIRDGSRYHFYPHLQFQVQLSTEHFTRQFQDNEEIHLFFRDLTEGVRSPWRLKGRNNLLGVEAKVSYHTDQEIPLILTLGTTYEREVSREFVKYIQRSIEDQCGRYAIILSKNLPLRDDLILEEAATN